MGQRFGLNDGPVENLLIFEDAPDGANVVRSRSVTVKVVAF
jgi:hypothetical protein